MNLSYVVKTTYLHFFQNDRGLVSFYLFKFVLVCLCVIPAFMLGNWQKFSSYLDPTFNYMMDPDYPVSFFYSVGDVK